MNSSQRDSLRSQSDFDASFGEHYSTESDTASDDDSNFDAMSLRSAHQSLSRTTSIRAGLSIGKVKSIFGKGSSGKGNKSLSRKSSSMASMSSMLSEKQTRASENHRSLFIFYPENKFRKLLIRITRSKYFDYFIVVLIFLNCISLAMDNPLNSPGLDFALEIFEWVFTILFTIETVMKVIAQGFILHEGSYMRNAWNILDITIVALGYLSAVPGVANYSALRSLRALRPLRTVNGIPGLKTIVNALIQSIPPFLNVVALLFFFFFIFGILALQLWTGVLRNRCVYSDSATQVNGTIVWRVVYDAGSPVFCATTPDWLLGYKCTEPNQHCQAYADANPNFGFTNFDNIGSAFLQIFQIITLEGWTDLMYIVQDAYGYISFFYFLFLVVFGGFFIINLALAVINEKFIIEQNKLKKEKTPKKTFKMKVYEKLMSYKVIAWIINKLKWLDYVSDAEEDEEEATPAPSQLGNRTSSMGSFRRGSLPSSIYDGYDSDTSVTKASHIKSMDNEMGVKPKEIHTPGRRQSISFKKVITGCFTGIGKLNHKIRKFVHDLVSPDGERDWFRKLIMLIIVLNTVFLGLEYYDMPQSLVRSLEIANYVFIGVFTVELILKLYGLGISFFKDTFNILDMLVVIASYLELIFSGVSSFSVLRSFRLLRIFKLLSWSSLRSMTDTIIKSFSSIFYLSIILMLFLFIVALIGMQTFSGKMDLIPTGKPHQHFDNFFVSLVTVFTLVTRENWNELYWKAMVAIQGDLFSEISTTVYFILVIVFGDFIILNLFLAILIQSFADNTDEQHKKLYENASVGNMEGYTTESDLSSNSSIHTLSMIGSQRSNKKRNRRRGSGKKGIISKLAYWLATSFRSIKKNPENQRRAHAILNSGMSEISHKPSGTSVRSGTSNYSDDDLATKAKITTYVLDGRSFFMGPEHPIRVFLQKFFSFILVEYFLLFCVTISSILLAVEEPHVTRESVLGLILFIFNIIFASIFLVEMCLKIVMLGVIWNKHSYFRDWWNVLDFVIVVISILTLVIRDERLLAIKALRALRPLRFINKIKGLKIILTTLFRSIPSIFNVLIISMLIYIIFGILGVQLFKGQFRYCTIDHVSSYNLCIYPDGIDRSADFVWDRVLETCSFRESFAEKIITKSDCVFPMKWVNHRQNFDNLANAILTLFEVATLEGWPNLLNRAIDIVGVDMQPKFHANLLNAAFFIGFIVIGSMFVLNLFVGVVIYNFNRIKEEEDGSLDLTSAQKDWVSTQLLFTKLRLAKKNHPPKFLKLIRLPFYKLIETNWFDLIIAVLIIINVIFMALEHDNMDQTFTTTLSIANIVLSQFFLVESIIKLIGWGFKQYLRDPWNDFDLFVVILSELGIVLSQFDNSTIAINPTILRVFRVFRIIRIIRLIKVAKRIRTLLETLYYSATSLVNVGITLILLYFVFSIIGMNLFSKIKFGDYLNRHANFKTFIVSMLTLSRISTGENWNEIMRDCMNTEDCVDSECGSIFNAIYFVTFVILATFVIINLFIAIILDNFSQQMKFENSALNSSHLSKFTEHWSAFDPDASYIIKTSYLKNLLVAIGEPLGLPVNCSRAELIRKLVSLDIPEHQGYIHFAETLIPLARRVYNIELPRRERKKLERYLLSRYKSLKKLKETFGYTTGEYFAATYIQAAYRGRQVRKNDDFVGNLELVRTADGLLRFRIRKNRKPLFTLTSSSDDDSSSDDPHSEIEKLDTPMLQQMNASTKSSDTPIQQFIAESEEETDSELSEFEMLAGDLQKSSSLLSLEELDQQLSYDANQYQPHVVEDDDLMNTPLNETSTFVNNNQGLRL
mmetsp:Transcript_7040/g.10352  ORF Transcript_7040/g.10352 Transcript_7040/m.10352 type:complete len:1813 (+) Transcript_7040:1-5439(+)